MKKTGRKWLWKSKLNNNKGFTLVEVITSFAVLAIISVALLQMFVVSTKTNRSAYDIDKANAVCIDAGEKYKANPEWLKESDSGFTAAPGATETTYTRYYKREWSEWDPATDTEEEKVYSLVIKETTTPSTSVANSYHPEFAWEGEIDPYNNIINSVNGYGVSFLLFDDPVTSQSAINLGSSYIGASITTPANITFKDGNAFIPILLKSDIADKDISLTDTWNINVDNTATRYYDSMDNLWKTASKVTVDIYISDAPTGAGIKVNPISGYSSVNYISSGEKETVMYSAQINVTRISDGLEMARSEVSKHLVS